MIDIDALAKFLDKKLPRRPDFIELRAASSHANSVSVKNSEIETVVSGDISLYSFRVLYKGSWGFSATNNPAKLDDTLVSAFKLALVSQKRSLDSALSEEKAHRDRVDTKVKINPLDVSAEDRARDLLDFNKNMKIPGVIAHDAVYTDSCTSWRYLNSEGSRIEFNNIGGILRFTAYAKNTTMQRANLSFGGLRGYELLKENGEKGREASERAVKLLSAERVKSGVYPVVVDHRLAGTLAHEAIGHACEADSVITGESLLRGKLGKRIAGRPVSIVDDPTVPGAFGSYPYDDEGVKSSKTVLLKEGRLNSYLHSRETAQKHKTHSTANSRAQTVGNFPIVRMSNTFFEPGDRSLEELLSGIKHGVYAAGVGGGAVDITKGEFQFGAEYGYLIENGKLTKFLRDISIFGNILDTLQHVEAVGNDFRGYFPGLCGKGLQSVRVSDGGPHIRIKKTRVGGS